MDTCLSLSFNASGHATLNLECKDVDIWNAAILTLAMAFVAYVHLSVSFDSKTFVHLG